MAAPGVTLTEDGWHTAKPMSGFIQREPHEGGHQSADGVPRGVRFIDPLRERARVRC